MVGAEGSTEPLSAAQLISFFILNCSKRTFIILKRLIFSNLVKTNPSLNRVGNKKN